MLTVKSLNFKVQFVEYLISKAFQKIETLLTLVILPSIRNLESYSGTDVPDTQPDPELKELMTEVAILIPGRHVAGALFQSFNGAK